MYVLQIHIWLWYTFNIAGVLLALAFRQESNAMKPHSCLNDEKKKMINTHLYFGFENKQIKRSYNICDTLI